MSEIPTAAPSMKASLKAAGEHVREAGPHVKAAAQTGYGHVKTGLENASKTIQKDGWATASKNFAKSRPLLVGAAAVTTAYCAGTALLGRNSRRELERRERASELGR